jgi:hypothetical protein
MRVLGISIRDRFIVICLFVVTEYMMCVYCDTRAGKGYIYIYICISSTIYLYVDTNLCLPFKHSTYL